MNGKRTVRVSVQFNPMEDVRQFERIEGAPGTLIDTLFELYNVFGIQRQIRFELVRELVNVRHGGRGERVRFGK